MRARVFAMLAALAIASMAGSVQAQQSAWMPVGGEIYAPVGWIDFCSHSENAGDCYVAREAPQVVVLSQEAWRELVQVNGDINKFVKPTTDLDHWGMVEKWSVPTYDDPRGDCEDYVLLKRRSLIRAGWPRSALLITVVRDLKDDGHAVLTVKTDKGDYVLDNQNERIVLWRDTGYKFVKRQSVENPNTWVSNGDIKTAVSQ